MYTPAQLFSQTTGIEENSENVKPGNIFVALPGEKNHGAFYIGDAISRGAKFILIDHTASCKIPFGIENNQVIKVQNTRKYLTEILSLFYPQKPKNIVGVTGTNGKTSVVNFYQQICQLLDYKSASIGTLGILKSGKKHKATSNSTLTSPTSVELSKFLHEMSADGITHVAIEASSHGIVQHRLDNIDFKAVGFTNFSQDHLDYHKTMDQYLDAKLRIFRSLLKEDHHAILNADIEEYEKIRNICKQRKIKIIEYGMNAKDIQIKSMVRGEWKVSIHNKLYELNTCLEGRFQLYNMLCSIGLALSNGINIDSIAQIIHKVQPVAGRMNLVANCSNGAKIYIDYAHTPDSLKTALATLRSLCNGRLHLVFGCGGERDIGKRSLMGEIANDMADHIIITDDNPRNENPEYIRRQILKKCKKGIEVQGRENAIKDAIKYLKSNDILLIAGKGHENYQIIGNKKIPSSDFQIVKNFQNCYDLINIQ